jgi:hypothetical protein
MGVHVKIKQVRRRTTASLLAIAALVLGAVVAPGTAQSAQAVDGPPCPTTLIPGVAIDEWYQDFSARGVTLCTGLDEGFPIVKVQIIDLAAGAKLDVRSNSPAEYDPNNAAFDKFARKYLVDWATQYGVGSPTTSGTFSVTNASFFNSTSTPNTSITMPFAGYPYSAATPGTMVVGGAPDPNGGLQKRVLRSNSGSTVQVSAFPTTYTAGDFFNQCYVWQSCVVGFGPLDDPDYNNPGSVNSRTYVGTNAVWGTAATKAYILTGIGTVATAHAIMQHFGAISEVQLDGGGSTGMESAGSDWKQKGYPVTQREVPNVLVVSYAP